MRAYRKLLRLASGGVGTVHVGVLEGALGFRQLVALKEAHPHLLENEHVRRTFVDEAFLAARIHHANVVEVRDVEVTPEGITLVMPYIDGATLGDLWYAASKNGLRIPPPVALRIILDACAGLAAAHALTDENGAPLGIIHRDVSPQNLLIGADGVTRVGDFGVAKHRRSDGYATTQGTFKGKLAYAAPEYLRGQSIDVRLDVFALGVILWELLAMERLFLTEGELETIQRVQRVRPKKVSTFDPELAPLDPILEQALEKSKTARTATVAELATALEEAARGKIASHRDVAGFLNQVLGAKLERRRQTIRERLRDEGVSIPVVSAPSPAPVAGGGATAGLESGVVALASDDVIVPVNTFWTKTRTMLTGFAVAMVVGAVAIFGMTRRSPTRVPEAAIAPNGDAPSAAASLPATTTSEPLASSSPVPSSADAIREDAGIDPASVSTRNHAPGSRSQGRPAKRPSSATSTTRDGPPHPPPNPYAPH